MLKTTFINNKFNLKGLAENKICIPPTVQNDPNFSCVVTVIPLLRTVFLVSNDSLLVTAYWRSEKPGRGLAKE